MLKRAWIVVSLASSAVWLILALVAGVADDAIIWAIAALPWAAGPAVFYPVRYIVTGAFRRRDPVRVRVSRVDRPDS
jgi:hypothetical protein